MLVRWNALLGETCSDIFYLVVIFSLYKPLMLPLTELGIGCTGFFFCQLVNAFSSEQHPQGGAFSSPERGRNFALQS